MCVDRYKNMSEFGSAAAVGDNAHQCLDGLNRKLAGGVARYRHLECQTTGQTAMISNGVGTFASLSNPPEGLDLSVLVDLVDGDPAELQKFALIFLDSFETALTNVDIALAKDDMAALGAMGHRAKTTARNIGAMALGRECELLENLVEVASFDEARRVATGLRSLLEGVRAALLRWFKPPHSSL